MDAQGSNCSSATSNTDQYAESIKAPDSEGNRGFGGVAVRVSVCVVIAHLYAKKEGRRVDPAPLGVAVNRAVSS